MKVRGAVCVAKVEAVLTNGLFRCIKVTRVAVEFADPAVDNAPGTPSASNVLVATAEIMSPAKA